DTAPCGDVANQSSCLILSHSCVNSTSASFFGDPTVRISAVVNAVPNSQLTSLCDADYGPALDGLAQKILARLQ
ncbi:MAG: hypothetical protein JWN44_6464, partial [Myxococcales bacterium]|nr:hypothetical protein [Myxococcales bacterium]